MTSPSPLDQPVAYLVPLRDNDKSARSFVFVFTRWLEKTIVDEYLPAASNFTGHEIPFRDGEVLNFPLTVSGLARLPEILFARDLLTTVDWSKEPSDDLLGAFVSRFGNVGYLIPFSGFCVALREGVRPPLGMPEGDGALWRDGRATILIDLDGMLQNEALRVLYAVMNDLAAAAGTLPHERAILDHRAQKWDSTRGQPFSPEETLAMYQQDRIDTLDRLGEIIFPTPVARQRFARVYGNARERAEELGRSVSDEWRDGRRRNLLLAATSLFSEEMKRFEDYVKTAPPRPLGEWSQEFTAFRAKVVTQLRAALNEAMTQDYLNDPAWRQAEEKREVALDSQKLLSSDSADDRLDLPGGMEGNVLERAFGKELLTRAHLTETEKRVLLARAGLEGNDSLAQWAERNGMAPATARAHIHNAKKKIEAAKKLP